MRTKQLSMAATAPVIWPCACVTYLLGRGLVYVCPFFKIVFVRFLSILILCTFAA